MSSQDGIYRYTYGDYVQWTGDERWELVDGVAFDLTPSPSRLHQQVVGGLLFQIANQLRRHECQVYVAPFDVRLPKGEEADAQIDTVVQPDLVVVCDAKKLDDAGCRGAPDWILEVLSPRTSARDRELKRELYERSGVREYWHVEPESRELVRHVLDTGSGRFAQRAAEPAKGATSPSILAELVVDWSQVFGD